MRLTRQDFDNLSKMSSGELRTLKKLVKSYDGMTGAGFFSKAISAVKNTYNRAKDKAKEVVKNVNVDNALEVANKGINVVRGCTNKNPNWDYKPKAGEKHQILFDKNGQCSYRSRFSGPGTKVIPDVKELLAKYNNNISLALKKENFVSDVDREAMGHDIRYVLAKGDKDKIRRADEIFIQVLSKIKGEDKNVLIPLNAMKAKIAGEKSGVLKVYGGDEIASESDTKLLENVLAHLEQIGFGKKKKKFENIISIVK